MIATQQTGLSKSRPIPPLNRKKLRQDEGFQLKVATELKNDVNSLTFSLKSGRVIRQVNGAPQISKRNWKLPVSRSIEFKNDFTQTKLEGYSLLGEVNHHINYPFT